MNRPIARIGLALVELPLKDPAHAGGSPSPVNAAVRRSIIVALEVDEGLVGVGECAPPPDLNAIEQCWRELVDRVVPDLLGRSIDDPEAIATAADGWTDLHPSAAAGGETALWDLVGQQDRRCLAGLLGASSARIEAGAESGLSPGLFPNVVDLLRAIEPHLAEGYRRLTVAIAPGRDVEFVESVRRHYPDLPIAVDAGGRFDRAHADVFRQIDQMLPLWIEAPYPATDLEGLAALQSELVSPISLEATHIEAIHRGACRMARLSIQAAGGFGRARELHDLCAGQGVGCWVGVGPETGVGLAQAIHLATLPNCKDAGDMAPSARWFVDDLVVPPVEFDEPGRFLVPLRPGLGHLLDPLKVRQHGVRHQEWTTSAHS